MLSFIQTTMTTSNIWKKQWTWVATECFFIFTRRVLWLVHLHGIKQSVIASTATFTLCSTCWHNCYLASALKLCTAGGAWLLSTFAALQQVSACFLPDRLHRISACQCIILIDTPAQFYRLSLAAKDLDWWSRTTDFRNLKYTTYRESKL